MDQQKYHFSPENYNLFEGLEFKLSGEILFLQRIKLRAQNEFGFRDLIFREIQYLLKENILRKALELTNLNLKEIDFAGILWHKASII